MVLRTRARGGGWCRAALCAVALLVAGVAAAPADAYVVSGQRWPGTTIRYHNLAPSYAWALQQAVTAWNTSGTRLRFVKSSRARAQIGIRAVGQSGGLFCSGYASIGYVPRGAGGGFVQINRSCNRFDGAQILAHELGHVLGLGHENRRCATMNTPMWRRCENDPPLGQWRCLLVQPDDVRGAVRRYGGTVKPSGPQYCWQYPPPPPPTEITAVSNPPSGEDVRIRWRNTTSGGVVRVDVARGRDVCPADPEAADQSWSRTVDPGTISTIQDFDSSDPLSTGRYCYTLWSYELAGRTGGSATVWVDHVDAFMPPTGLKAIPGPRPGVFARLEWIGATHPRADIVVIGRKLGSCPATSDDPDFEFQEWIDAGPAGAPASWEEEFDPGPGPWCYAVWSANDDTGRFSRTVAADVLD